MVDIDWSLVADAATLSPRAFDERLRQRAALAAASVPEPQPDDATVAVRRRIAREHGHDATTLHSCRECQVKIAAWDAWQAVSTPAAAVSPPAPATPRSENVTAAVRTPGAPPAPRPTPNMRAPVDELSARLAAAPDDATRACLLAAAPRQVRESFNAAMIYWQLSRDAMPDPYDQFSQQLDAASDDDARAALFAARSPAFMAEWAWRQQAEADDWGRRYLALAGGSGAEQVE